MHRVGCSLLAMALVGAGTMAAVPVANADRLPAPRQVIVRLGSSGVHAPDSLRAGRYKVEVRGPSGRGGVLLLLKPDQGYTRADLRADIRAADRGHVRAANRRIRENLRFFGGAETNSGGTGALWETLYAGRYWLVGFTFDSELSIETVRVHGSPSLSRFPTVTASVTSTANGLRATRFVPQSGRMLVRNTGRGVDSLFLLRLAKGATYDDFVHWAHHPRRRPPFTFRGLRSTAGLSQHAGYVLRYRMRPGRYVVMESQTIMRIFGRRAERVRQTIRPLTVRPTGAVEVAPSSRVQGFQTAETQVESAHGWLTPRARRLLEDNGLIATTALSR